MPFPLFLLADAIDRHAAERRSRRRLADIQTDPHLSRDLGLPFRPHPRTRTEQW
ncbi:MAG: hypothetical protein LJE62_03300 [Silicimonas sp.]|jgi:hypothetical protein|nr:hypothetical protein [Silicimonas sp.]